MTITRQDADIRFQIIQRENQPSRQVCEGEILFGDGCGPLKGMKMVGFAIWRSPEGELYATFPSRAFGAGMDRRYFDFVRSTDGSAADAKRLKAWVLEQTRLALGSEADAPAPDEY